MRHAGLAMPSQIITDANAIEVAEEAYRDLCKKASAKYLTMPNIAGTATQEDDNLRSCNRTSAEGTDGGSNDSDDEMIHSLRSSSATIEASNRRGRSRKRSSRRKGDRRLRTKFVIESLHVEISELRRQNEVLRQIWETAQRTSQTQGSFDKLHLDAATTSQNSQHEVPCTVQVSDASDAGQGSDLEISCSDTDCGGEFKRVISKYDATDEEDEMQMDFHRLFYS
mmetsp:Transcript_27948/g.51546  ORF Transcript_27948/g.51546 Transcript_27948/m.51546 type:complete len:225 (+) Transcript_27948:79-753(+)